MSCQVAPGEGGVGCAARIAGQAAAASTIAAAATHGARARHGERGTDGGCREAPVVEADSISLLASSSAAANAPAVGKRSAGVFARAVSTTRSTAGDTDGR